MSTIHCNLIGGFGNCMFQYAYARAYAEQRGAQLTTSPWVGELIFDLPAANRNTHKADEVLPQHYRQDQDSLIYSRKQAKEWFRFLPKVEEELSELTIPQIACHQRIGDYKALGYVVVSQKSYIAAMTEFGYEPWRAIVFSELAATGQVAHGADQFIDDFYRMMKAEVFFRGNSTFSWWAATLADNAQKIYSPVIDGLRGGVEQDCKFVEGNWPKFANLPGITDLHLKDE